MELNYTVYPNKQNLDIFQKELDRAINLKEYPIDKLLELFSLVNNLKKQS